MVDLIVVILTLGMGIILIGLYIWKKELEYHRSLRDTARTSPYDSVEVHLAGYPPEMHDDVRRAWEKVRGS